MTINDGSVHLTDRNGKTVQVARLNSQLNVRAPGEPSHIAVDMVIADAGEEARIRTTAVAMPILFPKHFFFSLSSACRWR